MCHTKIPHNEKGLLTSLTPHALKPQSDIPTAALFLQGNTNIFALLFVFLYQNAPGTQDRWYIAAGLGVANL